MTKLKTLKDIENSDVEIGVNEHVVGVVELRQEAIKRVKSCCPNDNVGGNPLRKIKYCGGCKRDIWFNNLTEEDLK